MGSRTVKKTSDARIKVPEKFDDNKGWEKLESTKERVVEVRAIAASQPRLAKIGKKKPDLMEVKIDGGTVRISWSSRRSCSARK